MFYVTKPQPAKLPLIRIASGQEYNRYKEELLHGPGVSGPSFIPKPDAGQQSGEDFIFINCELSDLI